MDLSAYHTALLWDGSHLAAAGTSALTIRLVCITKPGLNAMLTWIISNEL